DALCHGLVSLPSVRPLAELLTNETLRVVEGALGGADGYSTDGVGGRNGHPIFVHPVDSGIVAHQSRRAVEVGLCTGEVFTSEGPDRNPKTLLEVSHGGQWW